MRNHGLLATALIAVFSLGACEAPQGDESNLGDELSDTICESESSGPVTVVTSETITLEPELVDAEDDLGTKVIDFDSTLRVVTAADGGTTVETPALEFDYSRRSDHLWITAAGEYLEDYVFEVTFVGYEGNESHQLSTVSPLDWRTKVLYFSELDLDFANNEASLDFPSPCYGRNLDRYWPHELNNWTFNTEKIRIRVLPVSEEARSHDFGILVEWI